MNISGSDGIWNIAALWAAVSAAVGSMCLVPSKDSIEELSASKSKFHYLS